ncbi:MAG: hypothetical protein AB1696_15415 [Planctomycetota bacterium]
MIDFIRRFCLFFMMALALLAGPAAAQEDTSLQEMKKQLDQMRQMMQNIQSKHAAEIETLQKRIKELESRPAGLTTEDRERLESQRKIEEKIDSLVKEMKEEKTRREVEKALGEEPKKEAAKPSLTFEGVGRAFQTFNPDISVIGDVLGQYRSTEDIEFDDGFLFRELELAFSGSVDPYARADVYLGIHKELPEPGAEEEHGHAHDHYALHLEEGYLTLLTLPWDLQARAGKFRTRLGKVNTQHLHALPWVTYPIYIRNYFGEEGMAGEGAELSYLVPNPWDLYVEASYEVFNNDVEAFAGHHGDDFAHLGHIKTFFDLTENSSLEFGVSAATAPSDDEHTHHRQVYEGVDLTFKWRPKKEGLYKSLTWRTELLFSQKEIPYYIEHEDEEEEEHEHHPAGWETNRTWGMFTSLDYQFARRWTIGGRFDFSEFPDFEDRHDVGFGTYLTFAQSEYCFWRLGYEFITRNWLLLDRFRDEHVLMLQLNFGLGPHRAHEY